jgi:NADH dehydrogenase FAD-containing subunit
MRVTNYGGFMRATVAVIGGGYGGIAVAKALDEVTDVVLVEPKEAFHHAVASLRATVRTDWIPQIFIPYDRLLKRGRVIRDQAVAVEPSAITLLSGEEIEAGYIVLATGSRYPFPAKTDATETEIAHERYRRVQKELTAADSILLLGAGPVGLELAGEIKAEWPAKRVTLVDPAPEILPDNSARLRAELLRQLGDLGVRLVLGTRLAAEPPTEPGRFAPFTAGTESGEEISADLWLRCFGVEPVSGYLAGSLSAARLPDGQIRVTETLQVAGHPTVFAIGDVASLDEPKRAANAGKHAEIVTENIKILLAGGGDLATHSHPGFGILVPLGPEGGAGEIPGQKFLGPREASEWKGTDLMVGRFGDLLS